MESLKNEKDKINHRTHRSVEKRVNFSSGNEEIEFSPKSKPTIYSNEEIKRDFETIIKLQELRQKYLPLTVQNSFCERLESTKTTTISRCFNSQYLQKKSVTEIKFKNIELEDAKRNGGGTFIKSKYTMNSKNIEKKETPRHNEELMEEDKKEEEDVNGNMLISNYNKILNILGTFINDNTDCKIMDQIEKFIRDPNESSDKIQELKQTLYSANQKNNSNSNFDKDKKDSQKGFHYIDDVKCFADTGNIRKMIKE